MPVLEVDVLPAQRQRLTAAQPGGSDQREHGPIAQAFGSLKDGGDLAGRKVSGFYAGHPWSRHPCGRIVGNQPVKLRVVQNRPQHRIDLPHSAIGQTALTQRDHQAVYARLAQLVQRCRAERCGG